MTSLLLFCEFIFPHPSPIIWLLHSCHIDCALFLHYNDLIFPLHVVSCWYISITTWYQALPLVTCRMKYWRWFSSTRAFLPLLLTRKRLLLVANSLFHMPVTLSLLSLNLFHECHSWWVRFLFHAVKQWLKHHAIVRMPSSYIDPNL